MNFRLLVIGFLALLLLLGGCKVDTSDLDTQRANIEKFVETQYPTLYTVHSGVYRYITNGTREGAEQAAMVETGDSLYFRFAAYMFSSSGGLGTLYYTNYAALITPAGLPWSDEPEAARLGVTKLLKGLEYGLPGCREGDTVQLFFPSDLGYGDKPNGIVSQNTPLAWEIAIEKVVKQ